MKTSIDPQTKHKTTTKRGMREYQREYTRLRDLVPPSRYGKRGPVPKTERKRVLEEKRKLKEKLRRLKK